MNVKYMDDSLCVQSLSEMVDKLLEGKDNSYDYFMTVEQSSTTIINLSLYKKNSKGSSKRIRIYKLDLSKYRITIFKLDGVSTYREVIDQDVKRLNIVSYIGKKLFVELFTNLFKRMNLKYLKDKYNIADKQLIDDNKYALDDIDFVKYLVLKDKRIIKKEKDK